MALSAYRIDKSYEWNYEHVPDPVELSVPIYPRRCSLLGMSVESPLGIAAGPLLNGAWVRYYASLGFSVLTYKTVRSSERKCYALPNLTPVDCEQLTGREDSLPESPSLTNSWAVSFGMPSKEPSVWRRDLEQTRQALPQGKVLSVSVVGTMQPSWTIEDLADDYARCAKWAVESGADAVETNFSCPNVSSCDGLLYQNAEDAGLIAERVRCCIDKTPYLVKIGHFDNHSENRHGATELLQAIAPFADGIATTNSIATTVASVNGDLLFDGQRRGICGDATRSESIRQTESLRGIIRQHNLSLQIVGVGGIREAKHVESYFKAGAQGVQLATSPMQNPMVGIEIRKTLAERFQT